MTFLSPITDAGLAVQLHIAAVMLAIALLPLTLWRRRKDRLHRMAGYGWVGAMAAAALSSFFISHFPLVGPFGPIHLLSVYVLWGLVCGVRAARQKRSLQHRSWMRWLAFGGLGVAGLLTFLPGRMLNEMAFGNRGEEGFLILLILLCLPLVWRFLKALKKDRATNQRPY